MMLFYWIFLALMKSMGLSIEGSIDDRFFWVNYVFFFLIFLVVFLVYFSMLVMYNFDTEVWFLFCLYILFVFFFSGVLFSVGVNFFLLMGWWFNFRYFNFFF